MNKTKLRIASAVMSSMLIMSSAAMYGTAVKADEYMSNDIAMELETKDVITKAADEENREGVLGFVERLYNVCLDREGEQGGMDYWADMLLSRQSTGISAAHGFIFSEEFQNKNCSQRDYLGYMYNAFFGRTAASSEIDYWLTCMNNGMSRLEVFSGFANSDEFANICAGYGVVRGDFFLDKSLDQTIKVNLFVDRLYNNVLNRECDPAGMTAWTSILLNHEQSGSAVAYGFVFSDEFISRNLCNSCYIKILYRAFMGRECYDGELSYWNNELTNGNITREDVFNGFASSAEFTSICDNYGIDVGNTFAQGNTVPSGECTLPHIPANMQVVDVDSFANGYAYVVLKEETSNVSFNNYYIGVINEQGEIIYYTQKYIENNANNARSFIQYNDAGTIYCEANQTFIREDGRSVTLASIGIPEGTEWGREGDIVFWCIDKSGFNSNTYEYHFYNIFTKTDYKITSSTRIDYSYRGNNIWTIDGKVYFANTNEAITIDAQVVDVYNGYVVAMSDIEDASGNSSMYLKVLDENNEALYDGTVTQLCNEQFTTGSIRFTQDYFSVSPEGLYVNIFVTGNDLISYYIDFNTGIMNSLYGQCDHEYYMNLIYDGTIGVILRGADNHVYATMIDAHNNYLFDPVKYDGDYTWHSTDNLYFYNGYMCLYSEEEGYRVYNRDGRVVFRSSSDEFQTINDYFNFDNRCSGGFVLRHDHYINAITGEELNVHMTENSFEF